MIKLLKGLNDILHKCYIMFLIRLVFWSSTKQFLVVGPRLIAALQKNKWCKTDPNYLPSSIGRVHHHTHLSEVSPLAVLHRQQRQVIDGHQLLHPLRNFSGRNHVGMIQPIQTQMSNQSAHTSSLSPPFPQYSCCCGQDKWVLWFQRRLSKHI